MPPILEYAYTKQIKSFTTWNTNYTGGPVLLLPKPGNPIYKWYFISNKDHLEKYISWG